MADVVDLYLATSGWQYRILRQTKAVFPYQINIITGEMEAGADFIC